MHTQIDAQNNTHTHTHTHMREEMTRTAACMRAKARGEISTLGNDSTVWGLCAARTARQPPDLFDIQIVSIMPGCFVVAGWIKVDHARGSAKYSMNIWFPLIMLSQDGPGST
jgi:hypothetical protein